MKDEIKEILDVIRKLVEQSPNRGSYGITHKKWKQLLDYITNLQEENKRLKDKLNIDLEWAKRCDHLFIERNNYKLRNKKAIEYFKYQLEQLDFYEDTKAKMLCAMGIVLLQGEENDN